MHDNLDDNEKEQWLKRWQKKKEMCDSLNDYEEERSKKENSIRKKQIVITSIQEKRGKCYAW